MRARKEAISKRLDECHMRLREQATQLLGSLGFHNHKGEWRKRRMPQRTDQMLEEIVEAEASSKRDEKRSKEWWAEYRERAATELGDSAALMERANNGDRDAQAAITVALDQAPGFVSDVGSFMARTEEALLNMTSAGDWTLLESRRRTLQAMRRDIAGPNPTALEANLAHCVTMSLLEADDLATRALRGGTTDRLDRRRTRAHNRAMSAARTLAAVRRLALPVVQVNVAQRQINVAAGNVTDTEE